ncbi:phenylacetate--CoA ligase family protein [Nitratifractor sp.]
MSLFETIYLWRYGQDIDKITQELEALRRLPREEFLRWQEKKKWEIAHYLYENNDFYRRHVGKKFPEHWKELPIVEKHHLQQDLHSLLSRPLRNEKLYINNTSGSSGHPLTFAKDYYTQARVWAAKALFARMHGIDYFNSLEAKFYGMPRAWLPYAIQKVKDRILRRERFVVFDLSDEVMDRWIERFRKKPFDYIYGYTSSIVLFARHCIARGIVLKEICPTLKVVIVTSETCSNQDRELIKKGFGLEARNEYGTADAGLIGYECSEGRIHLVEENLFIERDVEGNLLITDLFNKAFPLVRYKIGDMADFCESSCPCGLHMQTIEGLKGRTNDVAILKSGKRIPGLTFYYISRALLESSGILKEFIIRQTALDTFEFDVVSDKPLGTKEIEELKKTAEEYLESGLKIVVNQVDRIKRPTSGKIKHFYSEIADG